MPSIVMNAVYVKVEPNKITVREIKTGKEWSVKAVRPFTTKRLLIGQYSLAEQMVKEGMQQVAPKRMFEAAPVIVMHPMAMTEGGLSEVEIRVLKELAQSAGAKQVFIWIGHPLTDEQVWLKANGR